MRLSDWRIVADLCMACEAEERRTTWYPHFAGCNECEGFIFRDSDVQRQLGVCGCVVALEMELHNSDAKRLTEGRLTQGKKESSLVLRELLQDRTNGSVSRAASYYLHAARRSSRVHAQAGKPPPASYNKNLKTRVRMPKDMPRAVRVN